MAGLPGTGLGGIFYILLVPWMLLTELWGLARGNPLPPGKWRTIGFQSAIAVTILGALWGEGQLIRRLLPQQPGGSRTGDAFALDFIFPALAVSPLVILATMLLIIRLAARCLPFSPKETTVPTSEQMP